MKILNKIISNMNTGKKNQSKTITVSTKLDSKNKTRVLQITQPSILFYYYILFNLVK